MLHSMNAAQKCTEVIWKSIVQVTISAQLEELSVSWLLTVLTCSVGTIFERICRPPFQRNRCIWNYLVSRGSFSFSVHPQQPHTNPRYIVKLPHKSCSCCCCCCTVAALVVVSLLLLGAWFLKHVVAVSQTYHCLLTIVKKRFCAKKAVPKNIIDCQSGVVVPIVAGLRKKITINTDVSGASSLAIGFGTVQPHPFALQEI